MGQSCTTLNVRRDDFFEAEMDVDVKQDSPLPRMRPRAFVQAKGAMDDRVEAEKLVAVWAKEEEAAAATARSETEGDGNATPGGDSDAGIALCVSADGKIVAFDGGSDRDKQDPGGTSGEEDASLSSEMPLEGKVCNAVAARAHGCRRVGATFLDRDAVSDADIVGSREGSTDVPVSEANAEDPSLMAPSCLVSAKVTADSTTASTAEFKPPRLGGLPPCATDSESGFKTCRSGNDDLSSTVASAANDVAEGDSCSMPPLQSTLVVRVGAMPDPAAAAPPLEALHCDSRASQEMLAAVPPERAMGYDVRPSGEDLAAAVPLERAMRHDSRTSQDSAVGVLAERQMSLESRRSVQDIHDSAAGVPRESRLHLVLQDCAVAVPAERQVSLEGRCSVQTVYDEAAGLPRNSQLSLDIQNLHEVSPSRRNGVGNSGGAVGSGSAIVDNYTAELLAELQTPLQSSRLDFEGEDSGRVMPTPIRTRLDSSDSERAQVPESRATPREIGLRSLSWTSSQMHPLAAGSTSTPSPSSPSTSVSRCASALAVASENAAIESVPAVLPFSQAVTLLGQRTHSSPHSVTPEATVAQEHSMRQLLPVEMQPETSEAAWRPSPLCGQPACEGVGQIPTAAQTASQRRAFPAHPVTPSAAVVVSQDVGDGVVTSLREDFDAAVDAAVAAAEANAKAVAYFGAAEARAIATDAAVAAEARKEAEAEAEANEAVAAASAAGLFRQGPSRTQDLETEVMRAHPAASFGHAQEIAPVPGTVF
eukprot:TRINITY_DN13094_c0_g2_i1.p1 TRINITY_DN13094_c0_g2~~TRINITY_DN13094_c0_g2_i1.p1  ORF type:complete len:763 (-),score=131.08 TRINITY_DN13094_c0_g2_i1:124-2412(-)